MGFTNSNTADFAIPSRIGHCRGASDKITLILFYYKAAHTKKQFKKVFSTLSVSYHTNSLTLRTQLSQYVCCVFHSVKLNGPILTKIAQKLAFGSTKRSPCSDFKFSIFGPRYSDFITRNLLKIM